MRLCGLINGFWVAVVGLPSLAVTLAGLIGYRGLARMLIEDRSLGGFPDWFDDLGQRPVIGPIPFAVLSSSCCWSCATVVLHLTGFGRLRLRRGQQHARWPASRASGSSRVQAPDLHHERPRRRARRRAAAARLGAVRGSTAEGFELDIITIVLLGGVSIFGGTRLDARACSCRSC